MSWPADRVRLDGEAIRCVVKDPAREQSFVQSGSSWQLAAGLCQRLPTLRRVPLPGWLTTGWVRGCESPVSRHPIVRVGSALPCTRRWFHPGEWGRQRPASVALMLSAARKRYQDHERLEMT